MNIINNIKGFLIEQEYSISVYKNKVYVYNYILLPKFNDIEITIIFINKKITICGKELKIIKMEEKELLITGEIERMIFKHE